MANEEICKISSKWNLWFSRTQSKYSNSPWFKWNFNFLKQKIVFQANAMFIFSTSVYLPLAWLRRAVAKNLSFPFCIFHVIARPSHHVDVNKHCFNLICILKRTDFASSNKLNVYYSPLFSGRRAASEGKVENEMIMKWETKTQRTIARTHFHFHFKHIIIGFRATFDAMILYDRMALETWHDHAGVCVCG